MDNLSSLIGSIPSLEQLIKTPPEYLLLKEHQDKPLLVPLLVLLPFLLGWLFRYYSTSPVVLLHNRNPASIRLYNPRTGKTRTENLMDYVKRKCPSLSDPSRAVFRPTLWMTNGHLQTAYAAYRDYNSRYIINYDRELLVTPDGGTVSLDWAPSLKKMPADDTPTLVLLHGLTGGSHESYIRALVQTMTEDHGYRCIVFNARACANTEVTTAQLYSGSWTEDLRMAVKHIRKVLPEAKLMSVGFSLGANILVNYMGEEGDNCEFLGAMSVGNPFDLMGSCLALSRGFLGAKIYSPAMGGNLRRIFMKHAKIFENSDVVDVEAVKRVVSIRDFDDEVTRRVFKYRTVHEYYRMASSTQRVLDIKRPFLCLNALDDPIAVAECLPLDEIYENPFGLLATTTHGGHLGWFEGFWSQERWCTKPLSEFCIAMFEADRRPVSLTPTRKAATLTTDENESHSTSVMTRNMDALKDPNNHTGSTITQTRHLTESDLERRPESSKHHHHHRTHRSSNELQRRSGSASWTRRSFWATIVPLILYYIAKRR
ncbi:hypothetical protein BGZ94_005782 [Podila epigama]|nr:hypothetical protein BGZ94_005782 [Podila epigama]